MTKKNASMKKASPAGTLSERVALLEREVAALREEAARPKQKDWRRTIGMFGNEPGMKEIFDEAAKFREKDRERARRRYAKKGAK